MSDEQAIVPVSAPDQAIQKAEDAKTQKQTSVAMGLTITDRGVVLGSVEQGVAFATACLRSNLLPAQIKTPAQAFTIMMAGAEVGLKPFASWKGIYLTKANRLATMSKTALGIVRRSGLLEDYKETIEGSGDTLKGVVYSKRKGQPSPIICEFSHEDAVTAKLLNRKTREGQSYDSTYELYEKDMLLSRARGRNLDQGFSDVLSGMTLEGIAEDADAAEEERRGATPAEARPKVPAQGDPLADRLRAGAQAATEKFVAKQEKASANKPGVTTAEALTVLAKDASEKRVKCDGNHAGPCCADPECWHADQVVEAEPILDDPFEGKVPAEKKRCRRCQSPLDEGGSCLVCGWPAEQDWR